MVRDERSRHQLYLRLEEALGPDAATTLMEHLPPVLEFGRCIEGLLKGSAAPSPDGRGAARTGELCVRRALGEWGQLLDLYTRAVDAADSVERQTRLLNDAVSVRWGSLLS